MDKKVITLFLPLKLLIFLMGEGLYTAKKFFACKGPGTSGSRIEPLYSKNEKFTIDDGCIVG